VFLRSLDGKWHCDGQDNGEVKLKKLLGSYGELLQRYDDAYDGARSAKHLHEILEHVMPLPSQCAQPPCGAAIGTGVRAGGLVPHRHA